MLVLCMPCSCCLIWLSCNISSPPPIIRWRTGINGQLKIKFCSMPLSNGVNICMEVVLYLPCIVGNWLQEMMIGKKVKSYFKVN